MKDGRPMKEPPMASFRAINRPFPTGLKNFLRTYTLAAWRLACMEIVVFWPAALSQGAGAMKNAMPGLLPNGISITGSTITAGGSRLWPRLPKSGLAVSFQLESNFSIRQIGYMDPNRIFGYAAMQNALLRTGRGIFYSVCEWGYQFPWHWGGGKHNCNLFLDWHRKLSICRYWALVPHVGRYYLPVRKWDRLCVQNCLLPQYWRCRMFRYQHYEEDEGNQQVPETWTLGRYGYAWDR